MISFVFLFLIIRCNSILPPDKLDIQDPCLRTENQYTSNCLLCGNKNPYDTNCAKDFSVNPNSFVSNSFLMDMLL